MDGTYISGILVLWFFLELFKAGTDRGSAVRMAASMALLFFTRTLFQWYFFPLVLIALLLVRAPRKYLLAVVAVFVFMVAPYAAKQQVMFGTTSTNTFGGYHLLGMLWVDSDAEVKRIADQIREPEYLRGELVTTADRFNTPEQARSNIACAKLFSKFVRNHPIDALFSITRSIKLNFWKFWLPSDFQDFKNNTNQLVNRLPWLKIYHQYAAGQPLMIMTAVALILGLFRIVRRWKLSYLCRNVGLALPLLFILGFLSIGNRCDWSEVNRLRFIIEPVMLAWIFYELSFHKHKIGGCDEPI